MRGELKCDPTASGRALFSTGARFELRDGAGRLRDVELESVREHKGRLLVRFRDDGAALNAPGATLYADRARIHLEPEEYLDEDLTGCELFDPAGVKLGTVDSVAHYPASDMLVVGGNLVPLLHQFIRSVDTANKRIIAELPAGMLDE